MIKAYKPEFGERDYPLQMKYIQIRPLCVPMYSICQNDVTNWLLKILSQPEKFVMVSHKMLWKSPNNLLSQHNTRIKGQVLTSTEENELFRSYEMFNWIKWFLLPQ